MDDAWKQQMENELTELKKLVKDIHVAVIGVPIEGKPGLIQTGAQLVSDVYGIDPITREKNKPGIKDTVEDLAWFKGKLIFAYGVISVVFVIGWELAKQLLFGKKP